MGTYLGAAVHEHKGGLSSIGLGSSDRSVGHFLDVGGHRDIQSEGRDLGSGGASPDEVPSSDLANERCGVAVAANFVSQADLKPARPGFLPPCVALVAVPRMFYHQLPCDEPDKVYISSILSPT